MSQTEYAEDSILPRMHDIASPNQTKTDASPPVAAQQASRTYNGHLVVGILN